ncbi:hypothetical protein GCM10027280_16190 [Micromonospora polyrhachis]|uniref:Uncharacterized protein n=1 Tax=Micromonospora polyrhachis TaxID=1282883 RepID=A0A7W7SPC4_9ACTN|nr:hypothetical protein [Micromonospora polyrhachis]MBB4958493.1 hypothetical protein [Micromonospora polyrhachis]
MDLLDHLAEPASDLLARVDRTLTLGGVPAGHPIAPLLRRLRALPGAAAGAIIALQPAPLAAAGQMLRELTRVYDQPQAALAATGTWQGSAADAFDIQRAALAEHLTGGTESLLGRLTATADHADALVEWATRSRAELASTLVAALGSAEAVTLVTGVGAEDSAPGDPGAVRAAAAVGARTLSTVADAYEQAETLLHRWPPRLSELILRPSVEGATGFDQTTRIGS